MKITCDYCGNFISDTEENCPNCGAPNPHLLRGGAGIPKTLEELQEFCRNKQMPLEQMRFFLGEDCKEPKAFGIYKDEEENFVVYKNKSDGTRIVRYEGKDEAFAVNEIYQKLRNEVTERKEDQKLSPKIAHPGHPQTNDPGRKGDKKRKLPGWLKWLGIAILILLFFTRCTAWLKVSPDSGYYLYEAEHYYYDYFDWYVYSDVTEQWLETDCPSNLYNHYEDYWIAPISDSDSGYTIGVYDSNVYPVFYDDYDTYYDYDYDYDDYDNDYDNWDDGWDDDDDWDYDYDSWDDDWDDDDDWDYDYDSWDDDWDDDDWDYDYSGWDDYDTDWDTEW